MYTLLILTYLLEVISTAPFQVDTRNEISKKIDKRDASCDLRRSPLGDTYFRKTTPWGMEFDLPCPTGTLFKLESCSCEKKKCTVMESDPTSYSEYIDSIGDWVTGQCPQTMVYRTDYCMCTLPKDYITSAPQTSLVTVQPEDCPYRQKGPSSYEEYFPSIGDWVTNYCPHGTMYSAMYCKCISQDTTTYSQSNKKSTAKTSTIIYTVQPPSTCPYIQDGPSSYKEYVDSLGNWLTYDCSSGKVYSPKWCTCLIEGQTPDYSGLVTTPPLVANCLLQPSGLTSYNEYVPSLGAWVTNDCPVGKVFSQPHCTCVNENLVQKPEITTLAVDTTYVTNPDCDLRPVGKSTYQKYEKSIDAWVTEDCHVGLVFNVMLCHCVKDGVAVVTDLPVTSTKSYTGITNSNCPYVPVNQRSYKEYVADIGIWVTNDCPSDMVFNVVMCSCHPDGSADIIVVPITTVPPLNIPTVLNCPYKKSDDGYLEYVPEINIWINNACPIDHEFVVEYCTCLSQSDISKIPEMPSTTTTVKSSTTSKSMPSTMTIVSSSAKSESTSTPSSNKEMNSTTRSSMTNKPTTSIKLTTTTTISPETTTTTRVDLTTTTPSTKQSLKTTSPTTVTTTKVTSTTPTSQTSSMTTTERSTTTKKPSTTIVQTTTQPTLKPTTTSVPSTPASITTTKHSITTISETTSNCDKMISRLGERYYTTVVSGWGELTFMCPTGRIFHPPSCDCVSKSDIQTTTKSLPTTTTIVTTTTRLPTTTSMTTTTKLPETTIVTLPPTSTTTACPLVPSSSGPEYFKIFLGTFGAVELTCPSKQIFDPVKCRCYI
ncbi:mucin-5AC-like [Mytilus californianus]|uniref:mucin-5AC-like n=1 Tax=Mytilus californianus TaxID=6549 RepID=UPI0022452671|nr:mucin-5AC-like [Mytilus californianus]